MKLKEERRAKEAEEARLREIAEAEERKRAAERAARAERLEQVCAELEAANAILSRENGTLTELATSSVKIVAALEKDKSRLEKTVDELESILSSEQGSGRDLRYSHEKLLSDFEYTRREAEDLRIRFVKFFYFLI